MKVTATAKDRWTFFIALGTLFGCLYAGGYLGQFVDKWWCFPTLAVLIIIGVFSIVVAIAVVLNVDNKAKED